MKISVVSKGFILWAFSMPTIYLTIYPTISPTISPTNAGISECVHRCMVKSASE